MAKVQRGHAALAALAEQDSSDIARRLGLWFPPVELRPEILRPTRWILAQNPSYYERIVRKGDLRASILETLAHDLRDRRALSESQLAGLVGATLPAVRAALADLTLEGRVERGAAPSNARDHPVRLLGEARPARLGAPYGGDTTRCVIRLFEHGLTFVSRSEAKRLVQGLDRFRQVILDFSGVETVGQGFVDEVFRVWAREHPEVRLEPVHMGPAVEFMVRRGLPG